ncbi:uncharacterized protein LOC131350745 [Hemibagrus wyckioides]|uniref:uncharacterized protein LOC131350745 n=1 Tax=Hemibagrus wyckioides TaxID=337641 RepID=UPI00266CCF40|nr:uncharacterized protein LOC131350745 [Hemibagrus wyckioides]XP_058241565.1 uncharacterized protein LOC131350745 [Hemibagrus wyckioides]XP_058241574.1 uncharacterized protein LOC131350745 [Hemibagrus wyckioides]XP_058241584.1 uncharacterized protein LOC131350745 [Hemibagrus wyckioides]XP_058241593.1 uncharacterized protein LOC131350745 [Hemibagrus wyckioides]
MTSNAEHRSLSFLSWNTNGIRNTRKSPQKFSKLLATLSKLQADIVFIQETHIGTSGFQDLDEQKTWDAFFTVHSNKSKGVAILIKKGIQFEYICHDEDYSGGYIVLFCYLYGELFTIVNLYNHKEDRIVLRRLKEYLMETAEGVLVVGGDFNTVLHPILDRKPSTSRHSPFRDILEDFIVSLNLKDTWSCSHPTEEGFTRRQNKSYSRLDMFFMPEDKINRVCSIKPLKQQNISDHYPLVLTLTVQVQTEKKIPNVATLLMEHKHNSDRRAGKISGAEILSVIRSLTVSEEARPDELQIYTYKRFRCSLTEILKIHFNNMLKHNCLYTDFNKSYLSNLSRDRHIFNVDYLIFSQILAKRLSAFITPSSKGSTGKNLNNVFRLSFDSGEQQISWSFLKEALKNLKQTSSTPPPDFSILDCILPKVQSSGKFRRLQPGCPLTNTILNLALKHLGDRVFDFRYKCEDVGHRSDEKHKRKCKEIMSMASVCYERRVLLIHTKLEEHEVEMKVKDFKDQVKKSGIKILMQRPL